MLINKSKLFITFITAILLLTTPKLNAVENNSDSANSCERIPQIKEEIRSLVTFHVENVFKFRSLAEYEHQYQKIFDLKKHKEQLLWDIKKSKEYWFESSRSSDIQLVESNYSSYYDFMRKEKDSASVWSWALGLRQGNKTSKIDSEDPAFERYLTRHNFVFSRETLALPLDELRRKLNPWDYKEEKNNNLTTELIWGSVNDLLSPYFIAFGANIHTGLPSTHYYSDTTIGYLKNFDKENLKDRPALPEDSFYIYYSHELGKKVSEFYSAAFGCKDLKLEPHKKEFEQKSQEVEQEVIEVLRRK